VNVTLKVLAFMSTHVAPLLPVSENWFVGQAAVAGPGITKVKWSAADVALVPPGLVTVTSTTPAACAGLTAVSSVSDWAVKLVAAVAPKWTEVTVLQKPAPVI
jgi:hypothetical protein